jgi:hypothetical protein
MIECESCMHVCLLCVVVLSPTIDSNDECAEEEEVFEYQEEEDQGQANQGKPSTCCITESYHGTMHYSTLALITMHCFLILLLVPI